MVGRSSISINDVDRCSIVDRSSISVVARSSIRINVVDRNRISINIVDRSSIGINVVDRSNIVDRSSIRSGIGVGNAWLPWSGRGGPAKTSMSPQTLTRYLHVEGDGMD